MAGSRDAASRCGVRPIPTSGVRGRSRASISRRSNGRVRQACRFFSTHLHDTRIGAVAGRRFKALSGTGGDPVVELQTNFGGGKTHSMLALYHLFSGDSANGLAGVEGVLKEAGVNAIPKARRAVLVGTDIGPAESHRKPDGTVVNTLWGELAWQLLGKDGYKLVAESDRKGVSPGANCAKSSSVRHRASS